MTSAEDTLVMKRTALLTGVELESVEQGGPDGTPVIFLHGVGDSWKSFAPLLPHLPRSLRAIAVSQRGHGHSSRPAGGYSEDVMAADLAAFMAAEHVPAAVMVGHALGGLVALRFALDHPALVRGLVLIGTFAARHGHPGVTPVLDAAIGPTTDPVDRGFVRQFQESKVATPIPTVQMAAYVAESLTVPARVWQALFAASATTDGSADLGRITAPTLIVAGGQDTISRRQERDSLLAAIRGATTSDYPDAGHAVHWEYPAAVAGDIARFARRIADAASRPIRG